MTMHATREGGNITVHGNTGVHVSVVNSELAQVTITEDYRHVKHFWGQLGRLIEEAEAEFRAANETQSL